MTTVNAFAAQEAGGRLEPFTYDLGPIGDHDVDIAVESCGICHSDLSMLNNEWGMTQFPFVPGHEIIGTVKSAGAHVSDLKPGDRVGVGWHSAYCMTCPSCMSGDHNLCGSAEGVIVGRHGGFADTVRAQAASAIKLPDNLKAKTAGPLLCGGITVFNPFVQYDLSPTAKIGVVGIGGLGHMALKFAKAWGCEVTAFTSSDSKKQEAIEFGAHDTINSRSTDELQKNAGRFDMIISTVNVSLDWDAYIGTLKPKGRLHVVGAVLEPIPVGAFSLIMAQRSVSGSPVGSPATIETMLDFAARHGIEPKTEHFPMDKANEALAHLHEGKARYRIVLDR